MFLLNMFTSSYICNLLYNLCIGVLSGYIFYNSLTPIRKTKFKPYLSGTLSPFPVNNLNQQLESKSEKDVVEKRCAHEWQEELQVYLTPQRSMK